MKRGLIFILLLFLSCLSFSQENKEIDAKIADVQKYIHKEPVLALKEIQKVIEESDEISYYKGLAEGYNLQGIILVNSGINDLGLQSFINSLDNYMKINDTLGISKLYNNLGVVSYTVKKYHLSIYFFNQSLNIQAKNKKYRNIVDLKNNIGSIYVKLEKYDLAMKMHLEAMSIAEENNYILGKATSLNNIAVIYENKNNIDSALIYCKKSLLYLDSIPKSQLSITYSNLANMHIKKGNFDEAYGALELALKNANDVGANTNLPDIYSLFSKYYEAKGDLKKAYEYLKKCKEITEKNEAQTTESDFTDFIISMQQRKWSNDKLMMDNEMRLKSRIQWLITLFIAVVLIVLVLFFINIKNRNRILHQENALIEIEKKILAEELQNKAIIANMEQEKLISRPLKKAFFKPPMV
ncbi:MAG: tetratricopeptide repeat protein [Bacteroidales bacterium]|nr:tetratricopeptide repeat protein [Bacteroidales bacterium]